MIALLAVLGCTKDEPGESATDCGIEVNPTSPPAGGDFYSRGVIEVGLNDADDTATITMDGVDGSSWASDDGKTMYFEPSASLSPSTAYSYTISTCTGESTVDFTTNELGTPMSDPEAITGSVYNLDLQSPDVRIVIPEGVGDVLKSYLEVSILMEVVDSSNGELEFLGAVAGDDGGQDVCTETLNFPEKADFSEAPFFIIGPATTTISVAGYSVTIDDLEISGTFSSDGTWFGGGVLAGSVDTRPLAGLIGDDAGEDEVCNLVAGFGVSCIECPADGEAYCLEIKAVGLTGELESGMDLEAVTVGDCHEACAESCDNLEECPEAAEFAICAQ